MAKGYSDLAGLKEDERIDAIHGWCLQNPGKIAGVFVDAEPHDVKANRYAAKFRKKGLTVLEIKTINLTATQQSTVVNVTKAES